MAADSCAHVVLVNPAGALVERTANFNPVNGSSSVESLVKSALKVVAVFVERDVNGDAGGPFWDEFSGNNQYNVEEAFDGIQIKVRDVPGGGSPASVRVKAYFNDLTNPTSFGAIDNAYHSSVMGAGSNWIVMDDGQGSLYDAKLAEARTLVGFPTA